MVYTGYPWVSSTENTEKLYRCNKKLMMEQKPCCFTKSESNKKESDSGSWLVERFFGIKEIYLFPKFVVLTIIQSNYTN